MRDIDVGYDTSKWHRLSSKKLVKRKDYEIVASLYEWWVIVYKEKGFADIKNGQDFNHMLFCLISCANESQTLKLHQAFIDEVRVFRTFENAKNQKQFFNEYDLGCEIKVESVPDSLDKPHP